jgi:DNA-binding MarR family transcriptional regulator
MPQLKDHFNSCLYFSASAVARILDRSAREHFGVAELSPTQGFMLIAVRKAPGISVSDLAEVLVLDQSTVTKTLEKMVLKGLVQREPIGRTVRIFLTVHGEQKEVDAKASWKKVQLAYQRIIGDGDVKALRAGLTKAEDALLGS